MRVDTEKKQIYERELKRYFYSRSSNTSEERDNVENNFFLLVQKTELRKTCAPYDLYNHTQSS